MECNSQNIIRVLNPNIIYEQIALCRGVTGKARQFVTEYLVSNGFVSLGEITQDDLVTYRKRIRFMNLKAPQKKYYENLLEQVCFSYLLHETDMDWAKDLLRQRAIRTKTLGFMLLNDVKDPEDIDYDLRHEYQDYLVKTVAKRKVSEYVKAMDVLKLDLIRRQNTDNSLRKNVLTYSNSKVFLLYHPSYEIARSFYYIRNKEELLFDFSVATSLLLKKQIFAMLSHILETETDWHDRRERFIIPLKLFYKFCIDYGITDVEQITETQIGAFRQSIDGEVGTKTDTYMQIVDNLRRYLFISAKATNWNANTWYLDRFSFDDGRMNAANEIRSFTFGQVETSRNRDYMKAYMKYQLGISQKASIQTIRGQYYDILGYLLFLDQSGTVLTAVTGESIKAYIRQLEQKCIQPESFNRVLISIARLYNYLIIKKVITCQPIEFRYYLKKTQNTHHNRTVPIAKQIEILKVLKHAPEHLRLMYLNLWCIGLRINEVCVIKGDSYYFDGKDAWIIIHQNKMKSEKCVPIPTLLYELMQGVISANGIKANEYVFKSKKGGAYSANTFSKQFKNWLKEMGIEGYSFKSHDFRHTIATCMYRHGQGASIEAIRDYLGHKESDMTMQYLDFMQALIDELNAEYFVQEENELTNAVKRRMSHVREDIPT